MKKTLLALALAVAAGGAQAVNTVPGAISLYDLIYDDPNNVTSITAGDKVFSQWKQTFFGASDPQGAIDPTQHPRDTTFRRRRQPRTGHQYRLQ
jgi:hypothetical protein